MNAIKKVKIGDILATHVGYCMVLDVRDKIVGLSDLSSEKEGDFHTFHTFRNFLTFEQLETDYIIIGKYKYGK